MIRFVDLGEQICEGKREFAFFNTVPDSFIELDGVQTFCCQYDFESYWSLAGDMPQSESKRYTSLMALWVMLKCGDCE